MKKNKTKAATVTKATNGKPSTAKNAPDGLTARPVVKNGGVALVSGNIVTKPTKRVINKSTANRIRTRIDALKTAGIQKSSIARKMGMSDKVFSTRTSIGNWGESEIVKLNAILKEYNFS